MKRFGISIDDDLLKKFDQRVVRRGFANRSSAIAHLIKSSLTADSWGVHQKLTSQELNIKSTTLKKDKDLGLMAGTINLTYDHHRGDITSKLNHIQHDFHHLVHSTQHIHLNHNYCLEVVVCIGKAAEIKNIYQSLLKLKNIRECTLSLLELIEEKHNAHT